MKQKYLQISLPFFLKKTLTSSCIFLVPREKECSPVLQMELPSTRYVLQSCLINVTNPKRISQYLVTVQPKEEEKVMEAAKHSKAHLESTKLNSMGHMQAPMTLLWFVTYLGNVTCMQSWRSKCEDKTKSHGRTQCQCLLQADQVRAKTLKGKGTTNLWELSKSRSGP